MKILASAKGGFNSTYTLTHDGKIYAVVAKYQHGSKSKQEFATEKEAREYFETYTTPITEKI